MWNKQHISLVIPCKNEATSLPLLLARVPSWIDEVIVVDNNSTDATAKVARSLGARVVTEKRHIGGIGYGFAHLKGMKIAKGDVILTMDGDGTYPIEEAHTILNFAKKNKCDVVSCHRFPLMQKHAISRFRQFGVFILNLEVKILFGYPMHDILSGMWLINRTAIKKLQLSAGDWNFSPEIKLAAMTHPELQFSEYHINHHYRDNGASKQAIWKTGIGHLFYIAAWWMKNYAAIELKKRRSNWSLRLPSWQISE